ncbi:MAG: ferredoxin family protein [Nanoarchaeota archaeon]
MTYIVTENCVKCKFTNCVEACPVSAFHEGPEMLYINPDTCIDCNACVPECPVQAIYPDNDTPDNLKHFLEINAQGAKDYSENIIDLKKSPLPTARERLSEIEKIHGEMPDARKILEKMVG